MWIVDKILKYRILSILFAVILTCIMGRFIGELKQDNSYESFFADDDPAYTELQEYYETFGNDDFVFLLVDSHGKKDASFFKRLDALVHRLDREVNFVDRVTWIGNAESVTSENGSDTVSIAPFFNGFDGSEAEIGRWIERAAHDRAYVDRLVSADGTVFGIVINFINYPEGSRGNVNEFRNQAPPAIYKILNDYKDLDVRVVGSPVISYFNDRDIQEEGQVWVISGLIGMLIMLIITTRSIIGTVVPLLTVFLSIVLTMGLYQIFGFTLNMLAMMIPILILCVGIGDSVHMIAEFRSLYVNGMSKADALRKTLKLITLPMCLTTLTTALGFASFIFTDLLPLRELGLQAAIGAVIALVMTFIFALPVLSFSRVKPLKAFAAEESGEKERHFDVFDHVVNFFNGLVLKYPKAIILGTVVAVAIAAWGMTGLKIETAFIQDLPKDDPLRQDFDFVDSRMGGSMSMEILVETGKENGVKELNFINGLDRLQGFLESHPLVLQTSSFVDQLKQVNRAVHENDDEFYAVPKTRESVSELLLLYESGGGKEFDRLVSFAYDTAHVQVRTVSLSTADVRKLESDVYEFVRTNVPWLKIKFTGASCLLTSVADYLSESELYSFIYAFVTILIVMTIVFRSVKLGLLAMIPNVIPVVLTLGLVSFAGARVNMVLVILAPIILGVCIDDTIHFITRYRYFFNECGDYATAFKRTSLSVGRVLIFTTMISGVCLSSFMNSKFAGPFTFAWSSVTAFVIALICDLAVTPAVIMTFKPFGPERTGGRTA